MTRPERREGRKLTNQCPEIKPSTSPTKHRPQIIIQLSVIWTSRVRHSCPKYCGIRSPLAGREINELSPLISGAAISPHKVRAWTIVCPRSEYSYCRAFFGGGSLFRSYSSLYILVLRLDARALPSRSRKPFAKGLSQSSFLWHSYPQNCLVLLYYGVILSPLTW